MDRHLSRDYRLPCIQCSAVKMQACLLNVNDGNCFTLTFTVTFGVDVLKSSNRRRCTLQLVPRQFSFPEDNVFAVVSCLCLFVERALLKIRAPLLMCFFSITATAN